MKQIILITDGCSNVGINPVAAAAQARAEGLVVNVIGVVDSGELGELGACEIREIAEAGGGLSRVVAPAQLSQTMQMMTRKTVISTIHQAVNRELKGILGQHAALEELPPEERSRVVGVIDDLGESVELRVALLVDTSASMKPKLRAVEEAVRELTLSLQSRKGRSELAVFHFPGNTPEEAESARLLCGWSNDLAKLKHLFYKLNIKGTTPTGPALLRVVRYVTGVEDVGDGTDRELRRLGDLRETSKDGMLRDYVI